MDKRQVRVALISVIRLLEGVGKHRVQVVTNPYHFDAICRTLERRAAYLRRMLCQRRSRPKVVSRTRLYHSNGRKAYYRLVDGKPVDRLGRPITHPNGCPWTRLEVAAEQAQLKYRVKEHDIL